MLKGKTQLITTRTVSRRVDGVYLVMVIVVDVAIAIGAVTDATICSAARDGEPARAWERSTTSLSNIERTGSISDLKNSVTNIFEITTQTCDLIRAISMPMQNLS